MARLYFHRIGKYEWNRKTKRSKKSRIRNENYSKLIKLTFSVLVTKNFLLFPNDVEFEWSSVGIECWIIYTYSY
jgi:hypothetical protein